MEDLGLDLETWVLRSCTWSRNLTPKSETATLVDQEYCVFLSLSSVYNYVIFQCCIYVCYMPIKPSYLLTYLLTPQTTPMSQRKMFVNLSRTS